MARKCIQHIPMSEVMAGLESFEQTPIATASSVETYYESSVALETYMHKIDIIEKDIRHLTNVMEQVEKVRELSISSRDKRVALEVLYFSTEAILSPIGLWEERLVVLETLSDDHINYALENIIVDAAKKIYNGIIYLIRKMLAFVLKVFAMIGAMITLSAGILTAAIAALAVIIDPNKQSGNKKKEIIELDFTGHHTLFYSLSTVITDPSHSTIDKCLKQNKDNIDKCNFDKALAGMKNIIKKMEDYTSLVNANVSKISRDPEQSTQELKELFTNDPKMNFPAEEVALNFLNTVIWDLALSNNKTTISNDGVSGYKLVAHERHYLSEFSIEGELAVKERSSHYGVRKMIHIDFHTRTQPNQQIRMDETNMKIKKFTAEDIMNMSKIGEHIAKKIETFPKHSNDFEKTFNDIVKKLEDGGSLNTKEAHVYESLKVIPSMMQVLVSSLQFWTTLAKSNIDACTLMSKQAARQLKE